MKRILSLLVAGHLLVACAEGGGVVGTSPEDDEETLRMMYQEIFDLVEDRSCADSPECTFTPVGVKPCGGQWLNLVYSRPNVNEDLLQTKIQALNAFERVYNERHRLVSDCALAQVPVPGCVERTCVDTTENPEGDPARFGG